MNDETLKEQLDAIDFAITTHILKNQPDYDGTVVHVRIKLEDKAKQAILQLIKQDREKAVREARIDELEIITDHYTPYRPFLDDDKNVNIRRYCTDRIAKLSNPTQEKEAKG